MWPTTQAPSVGSVPGMRKLTAMAIVLFLALGGCAGDGSSLQEDEPTTARNGSQSARLSRVEACERFSRTVADFKMTDQQSATAFGNLARETADPALRAAIQRVSDGFARSEPSVSSAEVISLCR